MERNDVHPKLIERWAEVYRAKWAVNKQEAQAWFLRLPDEYKPVLMAYMRRQS